MTYMHTCVGCATLSKDCDYRKVVQSAIKGLGISSLRHRCQHRADLYQPGEIVEALLPEWLSRDCPDIEDEPPMRWFQATLIQQNGTKATIFVAPDTWSLDSLGQFCTSGIGYAKAPLSRIRKARTLNFVDITPCNFCGAIPLPEKTCGRNRVHTTATCPLRKTINSHPGAAP